MAVKQAHLHCKDCARKTLHVKHIFGGGMGCLLTILTCGLFVPVWLLVDVLGLFRPYHCQVCGKGRL
jgi:hypothetical protein